MSLEAYLYGVVPSEMPKEWLPEALKAQAVAARTYALAVRKTGSWFDLYPDTRSQVYLGIAHEAPSTTAAVQATAGEVVLYQGRIAKTYFFSSSGGRTASAPEVWPTSPPTPYLVSVPDPYDTISPHHRWGPFVVTASRLRRVMRARGKMTDLRLDTGPSGRVETVTAVGEQGESTVTGSDLRRALNLRSTWFRIGVLSLATPDVPVTFGKRISLSGVARSVPSVRLDQRQPGAALAAGRPRLARSRRRGDDQDEAACPDRLPADERRRPQLGRARVGRARSYASRGCPTPGSCAGYARPLFPGASVAIQRFNGSSWRAVARATIDANGSFEATVNLSPGEYRARLAPGRGFVPGVSPTLKVGPA